MDNNGRNRFCNVILMLALLVIFTAGLLGLSSDDVYAESNGNVSFNSVDMGDYTYADGVLTIDVTSTDGVSKYSLEGFSDAANVTKLVLRTPINGLHELFDLTDFTMLSGNIHYSNQMELTSTIITYDFTLDNRLVISWYSGDEVLSDYKTSGTISPLKSLFFAESVESITLNDYESGGDHLFYGYTAVTEFIATAYNAINSNLISGMPISTLRFDVLNPVGGITKDLASAVAKTITVLDLPSATVIADGAFTVNKENYALLKTIKLSVVSSIGKDSFKGFTSDGILEFPSSLTSIGASAFQGSMLTSIKFMGGSVSIGASAFKGSTSLATVDLNNHVSSIGESAFNGCTSLKNLIGFYIEAESLINSLGSSAFESTAIGGELILPASLATIGSGAFKGTLITGVNFQNGTPITSIEC